MGVRSAPLIDQPQWQPDGRPRIDAPGPSAQVATKRHWQFCFPLDLDQRLYCTAEAEHGER
jgi:hypothetical protein